MEMDAVAADTTDFKSALPDLRDPRGICMDTNPVQISNLIPNEEGLLNIRGDAGAASLSTDMSPFSVMDMTASQEVIAAQMPGCDTDQYFNQNFFQMDQLELPLGSGNIDRAIERCQSIPGKTMDLTPIHIKSATGDQYSEKLEALGVLNSIKSTPVNTNQYQVANPLLHHVPSEGSMSVTRGYYATPLQGSNGMVTVYLQQNSSSHSEGTTLSPPQHNPMVLTQPGAVLDPKLSSYCSTWTVMDSQAALPQSKSVNGGRGERAHPKSRWKPNAAQLCLLEQHFNSGYTKPTPELFAAVQAVGQATEAQVSVWLKNRLSRCKVNSTKVQESQGSSGHEDGDGQPVSPMTGVKREREEGWDDFNTIFGTVVEELTSIASTVNTADIQLLAEAIKDARHICCYGVGREGLVMRALASSLHHLGFKTHFVGDITMPTISDSDLFLVSAGPSYYSSVSALSLEAMRVGAKVIAFTSHKTADLPFAERVVRIPSQTLPPSMPVTNGKIAPVGADVVSFLPGGKGSILHMGASYEISLWLMLECMSIMLRKRCKVDTSEMRIRHTNLE